MIKQRYKLLLTGYGKSTYDVLQAWGMLLRADRRE